MNRFFRTQCMIFCLLSGIACADSSYDVQQQQEADRMTQLRENQKIEQQRIEQQRLDNERQNRAQDLERQRRLDDERARRQQDERNRDR